jgi:hypothetical protein
MCVEAAGFTAADDAHVHAGKPISNVIRQFQGPPTAEAAFVHVYLQMRQADLHVLLLTS